MEIIDMLSFGSSGSIAKALYFKVELLDKLNHLSFGSSDSIAKALCFILEQLDNLAVYCLSCMEPIALFYKLRRQLV
jgi:hypothetical protein